MLADCASGQVRFTVGIPVYNAEKYIFGSVLSVLEQTILPCEIIIFDDGSTDDSLKICNELANNNSIVRVFHSPNRGPFLVRRSIVQEAKGDYVIFLDSDDRLRRDALEYCLCIVDEHSPDIICFDYSFQEDFSRKENIISLEEGFYKGKSYSKEVRDAVCKGYLNQLCCKAIRRSLFDLEGSYEGCEHFRHSEDLFQLLPIVDRARSLYYKKEALYYYRRSSQSGTYHFSWSQVKDFDRTAKQLLFYGKKWRMTEAANQGSISQYCYLLKILFMDKTVDRSNKKRYFSLIQKRIVFFADSRKTMNIRWRVFLHMVLSGNVLGVRALLFLERCFNWC